MIKLEALFTPNGKVYTYECKPYKGFDEFANAIDLMIKLMQEKNALNVTIFNENKIFRRVLRTSPCSYSCEIYNTKGVYNRKVEIKYGKNK